MYSSSLEAWIKCGDVGEELMEDDTLRIVKKDCDDVLRVKEYLERWLDDNDFLGGEGVDSNTSFSELGLNSIDAVGLIEDIGTNFEVRLDPTIAWKYPNVSKLSSYIVGLQLRTSGNREEASEWKAKEKQATCFISSERRELESARLENMDLERLAFELENLLEKSS